jgi:hypothetical protein
VLAEGMSRRASAGSLSAGALTLKAATEFRKQFTAALDEAIINDELKRQAKWTHAIAVGDRAYVKVIEQPIRVRQEMRIEEEGGGWVLKEEHGALFGADKSPMSPFEPSIPFQEPSDQLLTVVRPE